MICPPPPPKKTATARVGAILVIAKSSCTTFENNKRNHFRCSLKQGGFSIYDEMCVNYIHYYPITDLEVCKSSIATRLVYEIFSFFKR